MYNQHLCSVVFDLLYYTYMFFRITLSNIPAKFVKDCYIKSSKNLCIVGARSTLHSVDTRKFFYVVDNVACTSLCPYSQNFALLSLKRPGELFDERIAYLFVIPANCILFTYGCVHCER